MKTTTKTEPKATLTMVVHFDYVPDRGDLERIVDEARAYGDVRSAIFETLKPVKEDIS